MVALGAALAGRVVGSLVAARLGYGAQAPGAGARGARGAAALRPRRVLLGALAAGLSFTP